MSKIRPARIDPVDVTVLTDTGLPKTWKCPHCGKRNRIGQYKEEDLLEFFKTMQHCGQCGYIHLWELRLTDEFKRNVVNMLLGGTT